MSVPGILRKVDAITVRVPDIDAGVGFYVDVLGHRVKWRNDAIGQAGLELPDGDSEIVLTTEHGYEPNWLVESVDDAVDVFRSDNDVFGAAQPGHRRLQGLHHQLRHHDDVHRDGHCAFRRRDLRVRHPAGTDGLIVEPAYNKLGWHASDTHGLTPADCRVPAENLLGAPGQGFRNFLTLLDDGRIAISALALG